MMIIEICLQIIKFNKKLIAILNRIRIIDNLIEKRCLKIIILFFLFYDLHFFFQVKQEIQIREKMKKKKKWKINSNCTIILISIRKDFSFT